MVIYRQNNVIKFNFFGTLLSKNIFFKMLFILFITFFSINNVSIAAVKDSKELSLYEALLPVTNLNKDEKNKVMREGFKNVVVQVSGSEKTLNNRSIQKAMNSAEEYVSKYYIQEDAENNRFIRIKYDSMQINSLLQQTNHPILAKRPSTSVWIMLTRDNDSPHWIGEESEPELFQQFQSLAKDRRVPLLFPLLDLTEAELISDELILSGELSPLEAASKRYNAEMVWFGKLTQQKSGWYGQWTLLSHGDVEQWDASNADLAALCKAAMDELGRRSASINMHSSIAKADVNGTSSTVIQSNIQGNAQVNAQVNAPGSVPEVISGSIEVNKGTSKNLSLNTTDNAQSKIKNNAAELTKLHLSVSGIKGIEEYSKVLDYLKTLPSIKEVEVAQVNPNQTLFELMSTANRASVIESLARGKILIEEKIKINEEKPLELSSDKIVNNGSKTSNPEEKQENILQDSGISKEQEVLTYKIAEVF